LYIVTSQSLTIFSVPIYSTKIIYTTKPWPSFAFGQSNHLKKNQVLLFTETKFIFNIKVDKKVYNVHDIHVMYMNVCEEYEDTKI